MPTELELQKRISRLKSHAAVRKLLKEAAGSAGAFWSAGKAFEYGILRAFELEGATVRYPFRIVGRTGGLDVAPGIIEEVDGIIYADGLSVVVESKDHDSNVDIEPLAKLRLRLERRPPGTLGLIFTRKGITDPALYLIRNAQPKNVLVWQGAEIDVALTAKRMRKGLVHKFRHAVEHGLPDYNLLREYGS